MKSTPIPTILYITLLLLSQTIQASGIKVDTKAPASNRATLTKAPNGIPVINIVKPNSSGLSHNKFTSYSVEKQGVILNNSNKVVKTKLAGYISYNPNLKSNSATTILNEVTGTSKSLLKGFSEIAGKQANLIIANPNGIMINGGGFINTPKVTLTTGTPLFKNDTFKGFDVKRGDISIEGEGFNANNIDSVALFSKALHINAKLYANNLDIKTGSNLINNQAKITSTPNSGSGVSIDSSLLGGVYANTITLTSSDKGVGVNLPDEVLTQDSLSLNANGDISLKKIVASKHIDISSSSNIASLDKIYANTINLKADKDINIKTNGILNAFKNYQLSSLNLNNQGEISALEGYDTSSVQTSNTLNNQGLIAGYDLRMQANDITNQGAFYSKNNLFINANDLSNDVMIRSNKDINLLIKNTLHNSKEGMIYSDGSLNIQANENRDKINTITNEGVMQAGGDINIYANTLNNQASSPLIKDSATTSTKVVSRGGSNDYDIVTTNIKTQVVNLSSNPALILSDKNINIDVNTLNNNYSLIAANGDITLNANHANNLGKIILKVTKTVTKQYRDERYCSSSGPSGVCFNHKHRAAYRGTFTTVETTRLPLVNYGIQAGGSLKGDVVTLNNLSQQAGSLNDTQILQKLQLIKAIETDSSNIQTNHSLLKASSEDELNLLSNTKNSIDQVVSKDDLNNFKNNLNTLKDTLIKHLQEDKISVDALKSSIESQSSISNPTDITALTQKLTELKNTLLNTQVDIQSLDTLNNSITTLNDFNKNKEKLKNLSKSIKDKFDLKAQMLNDTSTDAKITNIISSLQSEDSSLREEIDKAIDIKKDITYKLISKDEGLYRINTIHSLQASQPVNTNIDNTVNINSITLPKGKYSLFLTNYSPASPYLIEANPLYTDYSTFISSDYMLKKLKLDPNSIIKRLGDGMYETNFIRDSIIRLKGERYLKGFTSDKAQYKYLMDNALRVKDDLHLRFGVTLTKEQIKRLDEDIVWMEKGVVKGEEVLIPHLYLSSDDINLYGSKIEANNINLNLKNNLINSGSITANSDINIKSNNLTNSNALLSAKGTINLNAKENINNLSSTVQSLKDINLNASNINSLTLLKTNSYSYNQGDEHTTSKSDTSKISSNKNINLNAKKSINIYNTDIKANNALTLKAKDITISSQEKKHDYNFNLNGGYNKGSSTKQLTSSLRAKDISTNSNTLNIKASSLNANNNININAKDSLAIKNATNSYYSDFKHEVKGGLFGGGSKQRDTISTTTQIKSLLKAKGININSNQTNLIASDIKALSTKVTTKILNLISKKDTSYENHFKSKSGFLTNTVQSKGYNKEKVKEASIQTNSLILNNKDIIDKLKNIKADKTLTKIIKQNLSKENIIKILSSEYSLNQKEINQIKATLNNKEWNEKHTTLSTLGAIIVSAISSAITSGAGSSLISSLTATKAASFTLTQSVTAAATQAVVTGITTQLATSAITKESFKLDTKSLMQSAVTAGVLSYVNSSIIKPNFTDALRKNMNITKYVKNAALRGTEQGVVSKLTGGSFQNGFKAGATLSILNDTSLQMRKYVKENFDYSGKDGKKVKPKYQSAGINGDGAKIAGSHFRKVIKNRELVGKTTVIAPFGGSQTGKRLLFKHEYSKGGIIDSALEHFAGPHDFLSSWNYENIDGKTYLKYDNFMINASSGLLLFPAAPLAASTAIENNIELIDNIVINKHYNIDKAKDKKIKTFMDLYNQQQKEMKNENQ